MGSARGQGTLWNREQAGVAEPRQERGKGRLGRDGEARSAQPKAQLDRVLDERGGFQSRRAPHTSLEKVRLSVLRWAVGGQSASSCSVAGKQPAGGLDVQESEARAEMPRDGGASAARKGLPVGEGESFPRGGRSTGRCWRRQGWGWAAGTPGFVVAPSRDREWAGPT